MSCCAGSCGCGSSCQCDDLCSGCGMYPDLIESSGTPNVTLVTGVAPKITYVDGEMGMSGENGGCPCGSTCNCDPCNCDK